MPTFNSDGEVRSGNTLLEKGTYQLTIEKAENSMTKSGTDTIQIVWIEKDSGARIRDTLFFSEKAAWRINQFLAACGFKLVKGRVAVEPAMIIGCSCKAQLDIETSEKGSKYNVVKYYITADVVPDRELPHFVENKDEDNVPF